MSHPFTHPAGKDLLGRVAQQFTGASAYLLPDSKIIFVCGGNLPDDMRTRFREYAKTELSHLRIFLAEDAQKDYVTHPEPEFHNVGEFEDIIGEVSECVILFPESPGSFAELGYFARNDSLRKKLLVVNDSHLQGQDSFIALGPINLIDKHSRFQPTIQIDRAAPDFQLVKQRLRERINGKYRRKFEFHGYGKLETRDKFFATFELVRLFRVVTFEGIAHAFRRCFKNINPQELRHFLSILVAAGLVRRVGNGREYFCAAPEVKSFFEFEALDLPAFRLEAMDFYQKHFPSISDLCRELQQ